MECSTARDTIKDLHGRDKMHARGETAMELAIEHVAGCSSCAVWFSSDMCAKMRMLGDADVCMMHVALHEPLGTECEVV